MLNTTAEYNEFKNSSDTLRIYQADQCIFKSDKEMLFPLVEFVSTYTIKNGQLIILDKVMGNAAALLSVKAGAVKVYSPLGSQLASNTLNEYKVEHYLEKMVSFILAANGRDMCPMEKLSLGKKPEEFMSALKARINQADKSRSDPG